MNNSQQAPRSLGVAQKRQIFGTAELGDRADGTLGDVISFAAAQLLRRETRLTDIHLEKLLANPIPNGSRFVFMSHAPTHADVCGQLKVWVQCANTSQGGHLYHAHSASLSSVSFGHKEPVWWEVEDDVVVGTEPVYLDADQPQGEEHAETHA